MTEELEELDPREREARRLPPFKKGEQVRVEKPLTASDAPFNGKDGTFIGVRHDDMASVLFKNDRRFLISVSALRRLLPDEIQEDEQPENGKPEVMEGYGFLS